MGTMNESTADLLERELVITRLFNAPRALVFGAWSQPEQLAAWWGPRGFTTTVHEMDVRPGGVARFVMHGPDGVDYPNRIVYSEVVMPERLAYTHGDDGDAAGEAFEVTVTFEEQGGGTNVTMRMVFASAEEYQKVKEFGAVEGGNQTLDRLGEYVERMEGSRNRLELSFPSDREVTLTRVFDAPRRLVFEAWTQPEHVARWWGPQGTTLRICEIDLRVGGAWRFVLDLPNGAECAFHGVYHEIVRSERLVNTEIFVPYPDNESWVTTVFEEHDGRTTIRSTARYDSPETRAMVLQSGMEHGAAESYNRLAEHLTTMA